MSNQLSAKLTADVKGYKKAIEDAKNTLKVFNAEESITAQTMRKVYDVTNDQVRAYKKVLESMSKATDGTKTMKQASNMLKNDLERLKIQWANLSDTAKKSDFGKAMANSIRQAESQLKGMQSQLATVSTKSTSFKGSMTDVIGIVGKFAPALALGSTALNTMKDAFFNSESRIDSWGRTVSSAKGTYQVFLDTLNNGDWSNFFSNVDKAQKEMRRVYDLNDTKGSTDQNNRIKLARQRATLQNLYAELAANPEDKKLKAEIDKATEALTKTMQESQTATYEAGYSNLVASIGIGKNISKNIREQIADAFVKDGQQAMKTAEDAVKNLEKFSNEVKGTTYIEDESGNVLIDETVYKKIYETNDTLREYYLAYKDLLSKESNELREQAINDLEKAQSIETEIANVKRKSNTKTRETGGNNGKSVKLDEKWLNEDVYEELPAFIGKQNEEFSKYAREYTFNVDKIIDSNLAAHASTVDFLSTYDNETLSRGALNGLGNLNSGISSIYDTLSNLGEMDNPFKVFDSMIGIAQNVMGVVDTIKTLSSTMKTMGAVSSATAALEVANSNKQTAANVGEGVSETLAQNAKLGPIVGTITGVAMVGTMLASLLASRNKVPKFADGGIVYGATMTGFGLTGEYADARSNPEIIAPLDKLKGLLSGSNNGFNGDVKFRIEGRELVGILSKENRITSRR